MNKGKVTQMSILFFKTSVHKLQFTVGQQLSSTPFEHEYKQLLVLEFNQSVFKSPRAI